MTQSSKEPLLVLERVSHTFRTEVKSELQVLKNINVGINSGEVVAFLGPSGCGKTTTLKIMSGLISPTEGMVYTHGKPLKGINEKIAMVFQNFVLLPWFTVRQNVALGLHSPDLTRRQINNRVNEAID
ncbi:MAG: ATP-binding cassette domain-containing protein, partial [Deltaproteobacteria bacterium]|nr:ATP-binding cassette domain-containing protein [Deltaproteobacteria bacterium]